MQKPLLIVFLGSLGLVSFPHVADACHGFVRDGKVSVSRCSEPGPVGGKIRELRELRQPRKEVIPVTGLQGWQMPKRPS